MQSDIKDALSARYSKEGEVAILRKGMEKALFLFLFVSLFDLLQLFFLFSS
jgi:hypothetical protein